MGKFAELFVLTALFLVALCCSAPIFMSFETFFIFLVEYVGFTMAIVLFKKLINKLNL